MNPVIGPIAKSKRGLRVEIPVPARTIRCAIYTRQSVEDRTHSGFTSLDAQTESALAYIASMKTEGWQAVDQTYSDSGFSGGNTVRPALTRLITDIEHGLIDILVVYKIDRLSRSLLDFLNLLKFFQQHNCSFVSVTQQINTATSAGRLMMNIIAGFGEYERSVISERTSDKMCAARRKGKWCGGPPILGYRVVDKRLVVDKEETEQVRTIFDLYLQHRGMIPVCEELNRRGWTTKSITYRNGVRKEGVAWNKARLYDILASVTYIGQVKHKGEIYKGEHDPVVDKKVFRQVQKLLKANSQNGGAGAKNKHGALLKGLLKCGQCGAAMSFTYTKKANRLYSYYSCSTRMRQGKDACPTQTLPAQEIEDFVVEQIRKLARDPELQRQVFEEASRQQKKLIPKLESERKRLLTDRQAKGEEIRRLVDALGTNGRSAAIGERLGELEGVVARIDGRVGEIDAQLTSLREHSVDPEDVARKLVEFEGVWEVMHEAEQIQIVQSLIGSIEVSGSSAISLHFRHV